MHPESEITVGPIAPYYRNLNPRQKEAVDHAFGPLLLLAGAGSGKTRTLTSRIARLIAEEGLAPYHVLAVTFTNKAAQEMRDRISKMLNEVGIIGQPEVGTFHSVCTRLLRREIHRTPFTKPFVIYDDSDQLSLIKTVMKKLEIPDKPHPAKSFQGAINRLKCDAIGPDDFEAKPHSGFERQLKHVYETYQRDLFTSNALDFGEILFMTYRLLRDDVELRTKVQGRFKSIHVDEYQDTNRVQYLMLTVLAHPKFGGHQNICVVGDEDQSIYKWRGADIRNILDFEVDYPNAASIKLEQNYRSSKNIVDAASQVIRNNSQRKDKTLWTANEEGHKITRLKCPDERAEAEIVVREIKKLASDDQHAYAFHDFSIFYRTNAQSRQFEDVFRREKIPYQIVGGLRFYDRKEIKDILGYFRVLVNPNDWISVKRIINVPARGIGKTTVEKIEEKLSELAVERKSSIYTADSKLVATSSYMDSQAQLGPDEKSFVDLSAFAGSTEKETLKAMANPTFFDLMKNIIASGKNAKSQYDLSSGAVKKLAEFVAVFSEIEEAAKTMSLADLYHTILDCTGYVNELKAEDTEEANARVENLEELSSLLQEFEEDHEDIENKAELLPLFLEEITLSSDADSLDAFESSVKMMTLHSSKGLEFPVVFLVGMEEGLFPSIRDWDGLSASDEDLEEERRLCYVGLTRARQRLYCSHVAMRRLWGDVLFQEPSRFFDEINPDLMDERDYTRGVPESTFKLGSSRSLFRR